MELTQEHFDKSLAASEKRIVGRIDQAQEELARMVAETIATPFTARFDRLEGLLDVKDEVQILKRQMAEIRSALHLSA